ncbi:MAG TPA: ATP-binding cassette domain-containing protein, partial [Spirochaetia bacterium]|nr:ATP-binding cassette domain-containing protein [Spirochaetia bacterium]
MVIIEHLKKSFNGTEVLSDVNLTLNDGEVLTIIGMSGIGKSVLAKSIIGLIEPEGGRILLDGRDIAHLTEEQYNGEVRNQMSFIFQQGALWDSMTIEQNIQLALSVRKNLSRADREAL